MTARMQLAVTAIGGLLLTLALPAPAGAQATPDARWGPWLGCWALVQQPVRPDPREVAVEDDAVPAVSNDAQACVERAGDGVVVRTLVDGAPVLEQTVVADGTARAIERDGCQGTERAWWSSTGIRLFSEARLTCSGSERTVSGMAFIGGDGRWIDVQSVEVGSADTVRVRQFEPDAAKAVVPNVAAAALTIADVVEASEQVAPSTLEAAILESRSRFPISARVLIDLSEAGVAGSVTDLMVAVTFPEQFRIARAQPDDRVAYLDPYSYSGLGRWSWGWPDPYLYSPYFYSPFGYSYLGYYPSTVIITGGGGGGIFVPGEDAPSFGPGRVVNGQGYTRIESRGPEGVATGRSGGSVSPQGFTSGGSSGGTSSSGGGSSSGGDSGGGGDGGGSSSGGASSGGGGGRTAVPR